MSVALPLPDRESPSNPASGDAGASTLVVPLLTLLPPGDTASTTPKRSSRSRRVISLLLFAGGIAVVTRLVIERGAGVIWNGCRHAGPGVGLVFLAPAIGQLLHAIGWRLLLPRAARPGMLRAYRIFLSAQAGNELGIGLLGEPLKVTELPLAHREAAIAAVVLDNATAFASLIAFFASGVALAGVPLMSSSVARASVLAALIGAAVVAGFWGAVRGSSRVAAVTRRFATRPAVVVVGRIATGSVLAIVRRIATRPAVVRVRRAARSCCDAIVMRPLDVGGAFLLHYVGKLWIFAEFSLLLGLFGTGSLKTAALFGVASAAGSAIGAPVPGQVGVVEAAILRAALLAGVGASTALSVALVRRLRGCFWIVLGALFFPPHRS